MGVPILAAGAPPFNADTPQEIFDRILDCNVEFYLDENGEHVVSEECRDLISKLLQVCFLLHECVGTWLCQGNCSLLLLGSYNYSFILDTTLSANSVQASGRLRANSCATSAVFNHCVYCAAAATVCAKCSQFVLSVHRDKGRF